MRSSTGSDADLADLAALGALLASCVLVDGLLTNYVGYFFCLFKAGCLTWKQFDLASLFPMRDESVPSGGTVLIWVVCGIDGFVWRSTAVAVERWAVSMIVLSICMVFEVFDKVKVLNQTIKN